jgi:hypothetical protein
MAEVRRGSLQRRLVWEAEVARIIWRWVQRFSIHSATIGSLLVLQLLGLGNLCTLGLNKCLCNACAYRNLPEWKHKAIRQCLCMLAKSI